MKIDKIDLCEEVRRLQYISEIGRGDAAKLIFRAQFGRLRQSFQ